MINQRATGHIAEVERIGEQYFLQRQDLIAVGVTAKSLPGTEDRIDVSSIPGVNVRYLQSSLQLAIDVPPNWLPMQSLSAHDMGRFSPAKFGRGGLFNYNVLVCMKTKANKRRFLSIMKSEPFLSLVFFLQREYLNPIFTAMFSLSKAVNTPVSIQGMSTPIRRADFVWKSETTSSVLCLGVSR